jgi:hypothetical protein
MKHAEAIASLKTTAESLRRLARQDHAFQGYGNFPGGDPRLFHPDPECSTEDERAKHAADCEAAERNEKGAVEQPSASRTQYDGAGRMVLHITLAGYGLGVYRLPDADLLAAADDLDRAAAALESADGA